VNTDTDNSFCTYVECEDPFKCHKNGIIDQSGKNGDNPGTGQLTANDETAGINGTCICAGAVGKFFHYRESTCHQEKVPVGSVAYGNVCEFDPNVIGSAKGKLFS